MKKILSKLALFLTGTAMAIGVGIAAINSVYKEVFAAYSGVSPYTIALSDNSLAEGTSYIHDETTTKINGIDLTWNHLNPSNGQMRANYSGDANFYIFNTDALPGKITSIVVTFTNGSTYTPKAKVGTSAFGSEPITSAGAEKTSKDGSVYTWDFDTDNATYFCFYLETGTGSIRASTIAITYEQTPTSIEINGSSSQQTTFYVGDTFSSAGLIVDVNYANGGKESLTAGVDYTVSSPDLSSTGVKTVTITPKAGGKAEGCSTISYDITVNPARALESVTLTGDLDDKEYTVGESWDLTGVSVIGNYNNGDHETLGTLNSLVSAGTISYTLDPVKPVLDGTTLDIKNIVYDTSINATADYQVTGISVSDRTRFVLCNDETITAGNYMLVTSDNYAVSNVLTGNEKRIVAENDFEIENNCVFEPASKYIYTVAKDGDYYTFYNETSKYLAGTTANESGFSASVTDYARWTVTYDNGGYKLINKVVSGYLQKNSSGAYFGCYSSGALGALYLYKKLPPVIEATIVGGRNKIGVGATATITTNLKNGASGSPTFTSGNDAVLTVSANGDGTATVTAVSEGATTVTVHLPGCEDVVLNFTVAAVALDRIVINTQPTKINYIVGESFSAAGLTIKVYYSNGTEVVKDSGFNLSEVDLSTKGTKVVIVSYEEDDVTRTATFEIVVAYPSITVSEAIEIIKPLEKQTPTAETYRVSGKVVDMEWNGNTESGSANINIAEKYNEQDPEKIFQIYKAFQGDKTTYNQLQVGANIVIESKLQKFVKSDATIYETTANPEIISFDTEVAKLVTGISIYRDPAKVQYYVGDSTFDYAGLKVKVHYNDSTSETIVYGDDEEAFLALFSITDPDTSVAKAYVPVTVTHKETGFTAKFNVGVDDVKVSSISVTTQPTKTTYASGEEFDPTGIEVTARNNNGSTFVVTDASKLSYRTQSGDGKVYEGDTRVTVVYDNNNNYTASIPITVLEKYIVNLTATLSEGWNDDTYDIDGTFSNRSLVIKIIYSDGTEDKYTSKTGFDLFTITPPDMSTPGDKDVTIALKNTNFTTTVKIHIRGIEELSIDQLPYRTTYRVGDQLDFEGLELNALYSDAHVQEVDPTWENVAVTGSTSKDGPQQTVTFTYKGATASYKIDVWLTNEMRETLIKSEIAKIRNSLLQEDYSSNNWATIQGIISDLESTLSDYDASKEGQHYTSDVMDYIELAIEEINAVPMRSITKITVTSPTKTTYEIGETFDTSGLMVMAYFENGDMRVISIDMCTITGFDSSTAGTKNITVSYAGVSTTFTITVKEPEPDPTEVTLESIAVTTNPTKVEYVVGDELDTTGLVVTASYSDGTTQVVTGYELSGYDKTVAGTQTVTVTYEGKTATFEVVVKTAEEVATAEAKSNAIAEYNDYFDSIDLSGYSDEVIAEFMDAKEAALAAINNATTEEEVAAALENARAALNKIVSDNTPEPVVQNNNLGLIIGLSVGGAVLLAGGVVLAIILIKRKRLAA